MLRSGAALGRKSCGRRRGELVPPLLLGISLPFGPRSAGGAALAPGPHTIPLSPCHHPCAPDDRAPSRALGARESIAAPGGRPQTSEGNLRNVTRSALPGALRRPLCEAGVGASLAAGLLPAHDAHHHADADGLIDTCC